MSRINATQAARFRPLLRVLLACYWLAMFAGTHWPRLRLPQPTNHFDKVLHFFGYGGLSFLIALWMSTARPVTRRDLARIFALLVAYSIFDEVTQIPVGRTCDILDAFADWVGCVTALSVFVLARFTVRRLAAV